MNYCCWLYNIIVESEVFRYNKSSLKTDYGLRIMVGFRLSFLSEGIMSLIDTSRFISLILRHKPQIIGITLDEHGWANTKELIAGVNTRYPLDAATLEQIVRMDDKQRYSFNEDQTLIRANQGHSIPVDVELEEIAPPQFLWHGTGEKYTQSIEVQGLIPKSRLYVHLSADKATAHKVGSRHGNPVIFCVLSGAMYRNGFRFYRSVNGVWLTKAVPAMYLQNESDWQEM